MLCGGTDLRGNAALLDIAVELVTTAGNMARSDVMTRPARYALRHFEYRIGRPQA